MHVVLNIFGHVIVHDILDIGNVDPTGSDVSGNQNQSAPSAKIVQNPISLPLFFVTVDGSGGVLLISNLAAQLLRAPLCFSKDQHLAPCTTMLLQPFEKPVSLVHLRYNFHDLLNVGIGLQFSTAHLDLDGVFFAKIASELLNFSRPRRTPHQSLPVRANLRHNTTKLRLKAHVKHPVSLIQNQIRYAAQICCAAFQKIEQPTWSRDADLRTLPKLRRLPIPWHPTVDRRDLQHGSAAKLADLDLNLHCQLSCWRQYKSYGAITRRQRRLGVDVHN
mmetsp:Transcript_13983/g.33899  ORF Transcript_13983/g.33899 Transcript_13983/m.33899 type:complete len:276 (-) Transcript_13983:771-1598(-)